jgi:hypothetical protein
MMEMVLDVDDIHEEMQSFRDEYMKFWPAAHTQGLRSLCNT